jgi:hypothetical protein
MARLLHAWPIRSLPYGPDVRSGLQGRVSPVMLGRVVIIRSVLIIINLCPSVLNFLIIGLR